MREIKFRAWQKWHEYMFTPDYIDFINGNIIIGENDGDSRYEDIPLMQYTGLKDKNGKEIFEGDILKVGENLTCEIIYISENSDDYGDEINCAFHAKIYMHDKIIPLDGYLKKDCSIIGNIYENQELINK